MRVAEAHVLDADLSVPYTEQSALDPELGVLKTEAKVFGPGTRVLVDVAMIERLAEADIIVTSSPINGESWTPNSELASVEAIIPKPAAISSSLVARVGGSPVAPDAVRQLASNAATLAW